MNRGEKQQQPDIPSLLPRPEFSDDLNQFREAINQLPIGTHGGEVIQAFSQSVIEDIDDHAGDFPRFREFIEEYILTRTILLPKNSVKPYNYMAKLLFNEYQYMLLEEGEEAAHTNADDPISSYLSLYRSPAHWKQANRRLINNQSTREEMAFDLASREIQSNEPRRYAGLQLAIAAHANHTDMFPEPPSLVDAGTSAGLGLVQLNEGLPFKDIRIMTNSGDLHDSIRGKFLSQVGLSRVIGFDQVVIDHGTLRWIEANARVSELGDASRRAHRKFLTVNRSAISIKWANLLSDDERLEEVRKSSGSDDGRFDVSSALTSIYQSDQPKESEEALAGLSRGITVVQDFAELDQRDPTRLRYYKNIYDRNSRYNLFVKYVGNRSSPVWHMLGSWGKSGRCYQFTPTQVLEDLCLHNVTRVG